MHRGRGPKSVAKAYQKFGVPIPDDLAQCLKDILRAMGISPGAYGAAGYNDTADSGKGEVSAVPEMFDVEYLVPVQIGTPPQTLNLNLDTGSSDLWVFTSETPKSMVAGQKLFDIPSSSSARFMPNQTWSIRYGDGSASLGTVYTDIVSIGGIEVQNQTVESARQVSKSFTRDPHMSGLVGLAFSKINQVRPTRQHTFWENALAELDEPVFSANLKKGQAGNYNFGFIDPTEFTPPLSYIPVNSSRGFWEFTTSSYSVANQSAVSSPHSAIADTATTLLFLPLSITSGFYAAVPSATISPTYGGYVYACNATLPDITLHIEGYRAVIPGELLAFAPADTSSFSNATLCFGGIQSSEEMPFSIYGDIFFKAQWVLFDAKKGEERLGFASKPI